ncbi:hypothetical protein Agub_g10059, partial [Astrephomene gubernaculifera]
MGSMWWKPSREGSADLRISRLELFHRKFETSMARELLEILNGLMSLASVFIYVYDTYLPVRQTARVMYFACSITFSIEYIAKLLAARDKLRYVFWSWSVIDAATIVYGFAYYEYDSLATALGFLRLLRVMQVIRLLKAVTLTALRASRRRASQPLQLELLRRGAELGITLGGVVFVAACVFYELEVGNQRDLQLHQAFYWSCVTIATIGYGDIVPRTAAGQLLFPLVIVVIILVLPRKISDLSEVMQNFSRFVRKKYRSPRLGRHVILTGCVTPGSARTFIREFFHPDRGYQDLDLVLLLPTDPPPELLVTLNHSRWERRLHYLHGSPYSAE